MKIRTTVLMAAVVASSLALPSYAAPRARAPKPTCNLVVDATGDTKYSLASVPMGALDIKSADIASTTKQFAAVIRVADLEAQDASAAVTKRYRVMWRGQGGKLLFAFSVDVPAANQQAVFAFGTAERSQTFIPLGAASGVVDKAKDEIRVWANIPDLQKLKDTGSLKKGAKQYEILAESFTNNGWQFDMATGDAKSVYYVNNPSCAPVGK